LQDVFQQALRTEKWIGNPNLFKQIQENLIKKQNSQIIKGELKDEFAASFRAYDNWQYEVVIVHPGISKEAILHEKKKNASVLLLNCYDSMKACGASLKIVCSK